MRHVCCLTQISANSLLLRRASLHWGHRQLSPAAIDGAGMWAGLCKREKEADSFAFIFGCKSEKRLKKGSVESAVLVQFFLR